jgi:hypothetical protein
LMKRSPTTMIAANIATQYTLSGPCTRDVRPISHEMRRNFRPCGTLVVPLFLLHHTTLHETESSCLLLIPGQAEFLSSGYPHALQPSTGHLTFLLIF